MTIENIIKSVSYEIFVFFLAVCAAVDARLRERERFKTRDEGGDAFA